MITNLIKVYENIVEERVFKNLKGLGNPSNESLKAGRVNLKNHENYIEWILKKNIHCRWIFSIADIICASYFSTLDYLGEIDWERINFTKNGMQIKVGLHLEIFLRKTFFNPGFKKL